MLFLKISVSGSDMECVLYYSTLKNVIIKVLSEYWHLFVTAVCNLLKIIEEYMVCLFISSLILNSLVFPVLKLMKLLQLKSSKCIMELCNSNLGYPDVFLAFPGKYRSSTLKLATPVSFIICNFPT